MEPVKNIIGETEDCGEYLGMGDSYDLMKGHIYSCRGKAATAFRKAKDEK